MWASLEGTGLHDVSGRSLGVIGSVGVRDDLEAAWAALVLEPDLADLFVPGHDVPDGDRRREAQDGRGALRDERDREAAVLRP